MPHCPLPGLFLLQAFAGIVTVSVGHCHPTVTKAVIEQTQRLQHTTTIYLNNQVAEYGKELAAKMPGNLKVGALCTVNCLCGHPAFPLSILVDGVADYGTEPAAKLSGDLEVCS